MVITETTRNSILQSLHSEGLRKSFSCKGKKFNWFESKPSPNLLGHWIWAPIHHESETT
jgi:hypothetical protein